MIVLYVLRCVLFIAAANVASFALVPIAVFVLAVLVVA
jgi:hypothetical protein